MAKNIPQILQQFFDDNGDPLSGGFVYTYVANSTTPLATYTDRGGLTANENPVELDSAGRADIWCSAGLYKFVIADSDDNIINTINEIRVEPVDGSDEDAAASAAAAALSEAAAAASASAASASASTASTQASNASTSASTATTQASNASTSASTATTQASNASSSASSASTSASTATTQASNASSSASAAAASALAADASADAAALSEIAAAASATAATDHIADTSDAHDASAISSVASGNLAATDVQSALNELQTDVDTRLVKASNLSDLTNAGTARTSLGLGSIATQAANSVAITGGTVVADFQGGTASDTQRITVPSAAKATLDGLTRKAATIVYGTDTAKLYVDSGASLVAIGSGGGGSSVQWLEDADAPTTVFEYYAQAYVFADAISQYLYAHVRVPSTYTAGSQINLRGVFYGNATSTTILMQTLATLVRTGTDAISTTTNQRTSTNAAVTMATTANRPNSFVCDLTDSSGQINSVAVSAGDLIKVRLTRDYTNDTATVDAMVPVYASEVTFT